MLNNIQVGPPSTTSYGDGATPGQLGGKQGDAIVSQLHGKYYTLASRGNVFYAGTGVGGLAFTIFSNATFVGLVLWNPQGSGKNLELIKCNVGPFSQAGTAASAWGYAWINNAGSGLATAAVVSALTAITATRGSAILGPTGQGNSVARVGSGATFTTALLWGRAASFGTSTGAVTTQLSVTMTEDFDGMMIVPPGTVFCLTSAILSGVTATASILWAEVPL